MARLAAAVLVLFSGCSVIDAIDGEIDDRDSCCLFYPSRPAIDACVRRFLGERDCARAACGFDPPRWVCENPDDEDEAYESLGEPY